MTISFINNYLVFIDHDIKMYVIIKSIIMQNIYIISCPDRIKINEYKVGRHSGSIKKLIQRYRTYLANPVVLLFWYVGEAKYVEKKILKKTKNKRILNDVHKSEWIKIKINKLYKTIIEIMSDHVSNFVIDEQNKQHKKTSVESQNLHFIYYGISMNDIEDHKNKRLNKKKYQ